MSPFARRLFRKESNVHIAYSILGAQHLGRRRPLIFLNGMGFVADDWHSLATEIAMKRPVLLFDHRGMGHSKLGRLQENENIPLRLMAEDTVDLICYLGWREVDLLGWSMGGFISQQILLDAELRSKIIIPHVILSSSAGGLPEGEPGAFMKMVSTIAMAHMTRGNPTAGCLDKAREDAGICFDAEFTKYSPEKVNQWIINLIKHNRPGEVMNAQAIGGAGVNFRPLVSQLPKSTRLLIIHGNKDRIVYPHEADPFLNLPQSQPLRVGPQLGQIPHLDFGHIWWEYFSPQIWEAAISHFLDDKSRHCHKRSQSKFIIPQLHPSYTSSFWYEALPFSLSNRTYISKSSFRYH